MNVEGGNYEQEYFNYEVLFLISHININGEPKTISRLTPPKRHVGSEREWSHFEELDFLVKIGGVCLPECQRDARTEAKSVARKNTGQLEILMLFRIKTKHLQNLILSIFLGSS